MEVVALISLVIILFIVILILLFAIPTIIGQWKVFEKAGKPGWAALIPYYNTYVIYELSDVNPMYIFFLVGGNVCSLIANLLNTIAQFGDNYNVIIGLLSMVTSLAGMALNIISLVFTIIALMNLAKCFGKKSEYGLGLAFLGFVFFPMLGFDKKAKYKPMKKA